MSACRSGSRAPWNQLAEQCSQYLTKGRRAYVEGRLHSHQWEGNDGQSRSRNEIVANRVQFLGGRGESGGAPASEPEGEAQPVTEPLTSNEDDDLPF